MARVKKAKLAKEAKQRQRKKRDVDRQNDVIQDTAAVFTCACETASDFAYQCARGQEDLETDLLFNRLALEIWHDRPGRAQNLVAALQDLLSERLRHQQVLNLIGQRLETLTQDDSFHIHLDPPETYRDLVRRRVFPDPPAQ